MDELIFFLFFIGFFIVPCYVVATPIYIFYLRKYYRDIWKADLDSMSCFPYHYTSVILYKFLFKNGFKKMNNKRFIKLSYVFKYTYFVSFIAALLCALIFIYKEGLY